MSEKPIVLFLCTANACRSQMGEALCRALWGEHVVSISAGVQPAERVDPGAVTVLAELGIDASGAYNKTIQQAEALAGVKSGGDKKVTLAVTVCDNSAQECPVYFKAQRGRVHTPYPDPPRQAREHPDADPLSFYRRVRDDMREWLTTQLPQHLPELQAAGATPAPLPALLLPPSANATATATAPAVPVSPVVAHASVPAADPLVCDKVERALAIMGDAGASNNTISAVATGSSADQGKRKPGEGISFFEKYLTVWVLLCMVVGGLIGYYAPSVATVLSKADLGQGLPINGIMAALLWLMLLPMMIQIDFASVLRVREAPGAVALTSAINYLIQPFTGFGLALLFFRVFYTSIIPDEGLRDSYIAGIILLAGAPCTAMVFVWSLLTAGDPGYTLVQVAVNDLLMLGLYLPTMGLLIGASNIALPWDVIAYSVLLFIVAPLTLAVIIRHLVLRVRDERYLKETVIGTLKPVTTIALLLTLVLVFIFQGQTIGDRPLHIVLVAIPLIIQTVIIFALTYALGYWSCIPHEKLAPASMISTSNFFELAVAVAISVYGLDSGAALATVVGVLVEVPIMLALVWVCNKWRPTLEKRVAACDEVCPWAKTAGQRFSAACAGGGCCRSSAAAQRAVAPTASAAVV